MSAIGIQSVVLGDSNACGTTDHIPPCNIGPGSSTSTSNEALGFPPPCKRPVRIDTTFCTENHIQSSFLLSVNNNCLPNASVSVSVQPYPSQNSIIVTNNNNVNQQFARQTVSSNSETSLNSLNHSNSSPNISTQSLHLTSISLPNSDQLIPTSETRLIEDLKILVENRDKIILDLKDYQAKARESIKYLLLENSNMTRKNTRQRVMENRLRLGQFVAQRQGSHFEEKWVDGWRFQELERRRKLIESEKDEIENKRRVWNKRKYNSDKEKSNKTKNHDISADDFFIQAEIFDLRKHMLTKEDKEIQNEIDRLDRERNLHIREIKRIMNEDNSRFKDHPMLNERYLLINLLGKGGFSEVHKGYDLKEQRYVACKVHQLNPAWPKEKKDNYTRHALREIEIHKTLNHPHIVKVLDVFDIDNDAFCTVLEYIDGNDLDFHLKQNKCIPERDAKSIMCQVVSALKYLNERRPPVIHYDLKPGNILLGSGTNSGEVKITDFGLSKLMTEDTYAPDIGMDLTSQGAGTYWYLPPECFETSGLPPKISSKVDVWSVGVIFYQCLFGKKPFGHNMSQAEILHQSTILEAKSIHFPTCPKVSDAAKDLIRRCCTYRKETRPDVFILATDDYLKPKAQLKF